MINMPSWRHNVVIYDHVSFGKWIMVTNIKYFLPYENFAAQEVWHWAWFVLSLGVSDRCITDLPLEL